MNNIHKYYFDVSAQMFLSRKDILAWILKDLTEAYHDYTIDEIASICLGKDVLEMTGKHNRQILEANYAINHEYSFSEHKGMLFENLKTVMIPGTNKFNQVLTVVIPRPELEDVGSNKYIAERATMEHFASLNFYNGNFYDKYGNIIDTIYTFLIYPQAGPLSKNEVVQNNIIAHTLMTGPNGEVDHSREITTVLPFTTIKLGEPRRYNRECLNFLDVIFSKQYSPKQKMGILEMRYGYKVDPEESLGLKFISDYYLKEKKIKGFRPTDFLI